MTVGWNWSPYVALSVLAAAATVALLHLGQRYSSAAPPRASRACPVSQDAFLSKRDLGPFTLMVNLPFSTPPWKGSQPGSPAPDFITNYRRGRIVGYIANIALRGPDVPAERAWEKKFRYKGKWPLVPLEGPVVRHNPGILEVYETIHSFKTAKAAEDWINTFRDFGKPYPYTHWIRPPPGAHGGVDWTGTMGPAKPNIERIVYYHARYGVRVLQLAFQGGAAITPSFVQPYWRVALQRFTSSCTLRA